uniref:Secreted protein n=1 Tax=Rhipicephalus appendiculatus TaxID=34631 RepID=A0A131YG64_RHIAP
MMQVSRQSIVFFLGICYLLSTLEQVPTYVHAIQGPPGSQVVYAQMLFPPRGSRAVPFSRSPLDEVALQRMRKRNARNLATNRRPGHVPPRVHQPGPQRGPN